MHCTPAKGITPVDVVFRLPTYSYHGTTEFPESYGLNGKIGTMKLGFERATVTTQYILCASRLLAIAHSKCGLYA